MQALKLAAAALRSSQSALGAYFRRLSSRMDKPKAVTAAAHKLARLIYAMLTKGQEYTDQGQEYYEERYRQRVLHNLNRRAQQLGIHSFQQSQRRCRLKNNLQNQSLARSFLRGRRRVLQPVCKSYGAGPSDCCAANSRSRITNRSTSVDGFGSPVAIASARARPAFAIARSVRPSSLKNWWAFFVPLA